MIAMGPAQSWALMAIVFGVVGSVLAAVGSWADGRRERRERRARRARR